MNESTTNSINTTNSTATSDSVTLQYLFSGIMILCIVGGLLMNILFIATVSKHRIFHRRSLFGLSINLSCIFFLDILFNQILTLIISFKETWIFSEAVCIAQSFCISIVDSCLSLTLFMFGIDRFISVRANINDKIQLSKGLNKDAIFLSIVCLWLLSICFSIPLVTKTIKSVYVNEKYSCCAVMSDNLIYRVSIFCLTIGIPLFCISIMYINIAHIWSVAKKDIVTVSSTCVLRQKFQIEKEINNSICTFVFHFIWVSMIGPYFMWLYLSNIPNNLIMIFVSMRNFYCWVPFIIILIVQKSFRKKLIGLIISEKKCSQSAHIEPNSELNNDSNPSCTNTPNSQQNTYSTNLAFNDKDINNNEKFDYYESDGNSSPSLSYSSSAISNFKTEHLPKVPVMFATESGVHIINEYFPEISESVNDQSNYPATLCDVNEAGFTDTSDAASMATENSFKGNRHDHSNDIKLPADITAIYNPEGYKHRRLKRRPQLNSVKKSLESAFNLPQVSPDIENGKKKEDVSQKVKKKKRRAPSIPIHHISNVFETGSSKNPQENINHNKRNSLDLPMNVIDSMKY